ncbi:uncharacterized protein L3040_006299 [Drepanopeziza brunnea f. sp. 'multigermtubi']|uniref:uncharacterized protein n=1 Tax=Drepanopeziza brunnea f. sp. 'multigermtubi' TaxID=698441 RepID=UPI0023A61C79|nr:hypothetical protein L3040_006299 [Drepanopeziza brunnea f. sp. 'multigermtubi']
MKHQNELAVKLSKLKLKKDTDTHMSNYRANDITRVVELAVAKALNKSGKAKSAPPKVPKSPTPSRTRPRKIYGKRYH